MNPQPSSKTSQLLALAPNDKAPWNIVSKKMKWLPLLFAYNS